MSFNKLQTKSDIKEKVVFVNKTSKVVKGGRKFSFMVIVLAGDEKGRIGFGTGKADEVTDAREKASRVARDNLIRIPLRDGRTIHHTVQAKYGSGEVLMRPAKPGTGVIAGGPTRSVMELLGVQDIVVKSLGSSNPHNMIKAALKGLQNIVPPASIAKKRGMKVSDIIGQREAIAISHRRKRKENIA